ncbi:spore wall protein 25-like [Vairimorpha necatrix]|uniref:Spore wall protein 25-like n=1 Tax=Vairimorpha necatrix TaxID=6039 RepID=A0AAX4JGW5_9MICR
MKLLLLVKLLKIVKSIDVPGPIFVSKITYIIGLETYEQRKILKNIYLCFNEKVDEKTLLFVAASLHNTSNFTVFSLPRMWDKYKSRGLLQICFKRNYQKLTDLSSTFNYVKTPNMLNSTDKIVIGDCIRFFEYKLSNCYTFENYVESMGLGEYENIKCRSDILNFKGIYIKLCEAFLVKLYN